MSCSARVLPWAITATPPAIRYRTPERRSRARITASRLRTSMLTAPVPLRLCPGASEERPAKRPYSRCITTGRAPCASVPTAATSRILAGAEQGVGQLQRVAEVDVVVRGAVDEQERPFQIGG